MEDLKWLLRKFGVIFLLLAIAIIVGAFIYKRNVYNDLQENMNNTEEILEPLINNKTERDAANRAAWDKGYDLPIDSKSKAAIRSECLKAMEIIRDEYEASKDVALDKKITEGIMEVLEKQGIPVYTSEFMINMKNPHLLEKYINRMELGIADSISLFEVTRNAGLCERKLLYDGSDLCILSATAVWDENGEPEIAYISKNRVKQWKYTEKGWFSFEYCVPEYPEVSEVVLGNILIRVRSSPEEYIEITEKYLMPIGYMGNNLFQSNWDSEHMEELDYNGLFESFNIGWSNTSIYFDIDINHNRRKDGLM